MEVKRFSAATDDLPKEMEVAARKSAEGSSSKRFAAAHDDLPKKIEVTARKSAEGSKSKSFAAAPDDLPKKMKVTGRKSAEGSKSKRSAAATDDFPSDKLYKTYVIHSTSTEEKELYLCYLLGAVIGSVVVFTNNVPTSVYLHKLIKLLGYSSEVLNSRLSREKKNKVISNFELGSNQILILTNGSQMKLASDAQIHFDIPPKATYMKHAKSLEIGGTTVLLGGMDQVLALIDEGRVEPYPVDGSLRTLEERLCEARQLIKEKEKGKGKRKA